MARCVNLEPSRIGRARRVGMINFDECETAGCLHFALDRGYAARRYSFEVQRHSSSRTKVRSGARHVPCHHHIPLPVATFSDMTMANSSSGGLSFASVRGYQIWEQIGSGGFSK